ncbi:putative cell division protein FtsN [Neisseria zoodegmatis]|uniref:Putative cell division protein FtsN n=1 Tax=Neisseria zoodegmatis TaxID=326523 RepID=A0A378X5H6_9NEIS|nr:SPOR domain-containing protein [Neisseria zoodegmatis]SUA48870.1 putative cell division protein FtsN [Neisseria zoodegmatis]
MNIQKPYGKGLSGFILGLLLATAVIAGIVFFINKSNEKAFKKETPKELPKPEILTPKSSEPAAPPVQTSSEPVTQVSEPVGTVASQEQEASAPEEREASTVTTEQPEAPAKEEPKPQTVAPVKPKAEQKPAPEAKKQPQKKPEAKQPEKVKKEEPKKAAKPSPEQILESGSIEKAREKARAESAKKEASQKAEARQSGSSEGGRIILQMGSFNNRESAESHRAKLAMMGVSGNVIEAEANGKRVYRVQSGKMNKEAANRTQQTLKQNGVDSFARTVK